MNGRLKENNQQFETIKLSTITPSEINKLNLISDRIYASQRIPNVPPIRVQTKLRDLYQLKGSSVCVNDTSSFVYKRPSVCKVKVIADEPKIAQNIDNVEKQILKGFYQRMSSSHLKDQRLRRSPKKPRNLFFNSSKLDESYDPIMITRKPYHMKYHVKDYSMEESYEKDLEVLKKKITLNSSYSVNLVQDLKPLPDQQIEIKQHRNSISLFEKYKPELILPEIRSSRYSPKTKRSRKGKGDSKVFLYNTPWGNEEDYSFRHSLSQPRKPRF